MRTWTFGRKIAIGFIIAAIALVVIGVTGYRSAQAVSEANRWVSHSQQIRRAIADLMTEVLNAETGQRGYVLTLDRRHFKALRTLDRKPFRVVPA